jgi:membrane fusion protein (multidrug efflux system)
MEYYNTTDRQAPIAMTHMRAVVVVLLLIFSLSSCQRPAAKQGNEEGPALRLPITRVQVEPLSEELLLPGLVFALPDHSVKVSPGVAGKVVDIKVSPGDHVERGQVIALLDSRQLRDALNQAKAKVLVAIAGVKQAETNLLLAENTEARNEKLVDNGIAAKKDLIAAESQVDTDRAQLTAAKAQVADARAAEAAAKAQLGYTSVKSPISGIVAQRFLNVSDSTDTTTPIVQVVDLNQVVIEASLPTTEPAKIVSGQPAVIKAKALPGQEHAGTVQSVNPVTDNQGTTVGVRILCDNPDYALKEGMPVSARIVTAIHANAMTVPEGALVSDPTAPDKHMVYIYKGGKIYRASVDTGIQQKSRMEILSGLAPGEAIVAGGAYGIPDGTEVEAKGELVQSNPKVSSPSY